MMALIYPYISTTLVFFSLLAPPQQVCSYYYDYTSTTYEYKPNGGSIAIVTGDMVVDVYAGNVTKGVNYVCTGACYVAQVKYTRSTCSPQEIVAMYDGKYVQDAGYTWLYAQAIIVNLFADPFFSGIVFAILALVLLRKFFIVFQLFFDNREVEDEEEATNTDSTPASTADEGSE